MANTPNTPSNGGHHVATETTPSSRRKLTPTVQEYLAERAGNLPVWIRSPKGGPEHYTGFSRAKLYQMAGEGKIITASIREPGKIKGVRLFLLSSVLDYIARCVLKTHDAGTDGATVL